MNQQAEQERLMTSAEVAAAFGVGTRTVRKWAERGLLAGVRRPGHPRRFRESEVRAMLAEDAPVTAPPALATVPLVREALTPDQALVLRARVRALNADYGPLWHVWVSDEPAGRVYATGRHTTEHAETPERMREILDGRAERARQREAAALDAWTRA